MTTWRELIAQIQVTRNHVSGYRGETVIYGEQGMIRIGCFNQKLLEVRVEAYGTREAKEPIAFRKFEMRRYDQPLPEFIDRYGAAYKEELRIFLECCRDGKAIPDHPSRRPARAGDCCRRDEGVHPQSRTWPPSTISPV